MIMEGDPFVLIEGMTIAGMAVGATQGYIYLRWEYPHAKRALKARSNRRRQARRLSRRRHVLGSGKRISIWKCAWAPAPISAARKPRCWKAWKASAARRASSRRCRR
jgi:hypothetical protein